MRVNGEALQLHAVYKTRILYYKSRKNSYDKVITTIVPWYTRKKYHLFVPVGIITHAGHSCNLADGNKLVIFPVELVLWCYLYSIMMFTLTHSGYYRIAGNFRGRKLLPISENPIFVENTFAN